MDTKGNQHAMEFNGCWYRDVIPIIENHYRLWERQCNNDT